MYVKIINRMFYIETKKNQIERERQETQPKTETLVYNSRAGNRRIDDQKNITPLYMFILIL